MTIEYSENIQVGNVALSSLIKTKHKSFTCYTAVQTKIKNHRQGGVRFVTNGSVEEVANLAVGMSEKSAAAGIPIDGSKCLIICPNGIPTEDERALILAKHIKIANEFEPLLVYGPDMNCPESVLDIVAKTYGLRDNVTGLTGCQGGIEINRNGLTAFGLAVALAASRESEFASEKQKTSQTVLIQGFGNVGAQLANLLDKDGYIITGVSSIEGVIFDSQGLNIKELFSLWKDNPDNCLKRFSSENPSRVIFNKSPGHLFNLRADIFVPAARTSIAGVKEEIETLKIENPDVLDIENIFFRMKPKIILEAANHPFSLMAEQFLEERDVLVLPDMLVNCGGMIGCWYEHINREALLNKSISIERALLLCRKLIRKAITENIQTLRFEMSLGRTARKVVQETILPSRQANVPSKTIINKMEKIMNPQKTSFPKFLNKLPVIETGFDGVKAHRVKEEALVGFLEFTETIEVPMHKHGAQWGIVVSGQIEVTIEGELHIFKAGDSYFIEAQKEHGAKIQKGTRLIELYEEPDRF